MNLFTYPLLRSGKNLTTPPIRTKMRLILVLFAMFFATGNVWGDTKTDIMFAKGFGSYQTNSFSAAGTDYSAVANSTNATGVTYAMQVFNGSTGAVRGNQIPRDLLFSLP